MKTRFITVLAGAVLLAATMAGAETRREIAASPGELLTVDLKTGGSVTITASDRSSVAVTATHSEGQNVTIERVPGGVAVRSKFDAKHLTAARGIAVDIAVPARFNADINTMGGGIRVTGLDGRVEGQTMGGELELSRLKGEVELKTMGGNVALTDSDVDGHLRTMGGKIVFRNVTGNVDGKSMGGNVTYDNVRRRDGSGTGKSLVMTTQGGAISVPSAPSGAAVETMGGNIEVKSAREFVKARTMGGRIGIDEVDGWVDASTMGGDIDVNVVGDNGRHDVSLRSMSGDVTLTLPASFSGTFEIELSYTKNSRRDYAIKSDFPLQVSEPNDWDYDQGSPRRVITGTGTSGSGTHKVKISTVNGDVVIRKAK